jgi:hypothetical protein
MSNLIVYVNSRNRIGDTDSNFQYYFEEIKNSMFNFTKVTLLSISIPKTYYLISTNSFFLNEGDDTIQLSMLIGNYNVLSFTQTLSTLLSSNSPNRFVYNVQSDVKTQLALPTLSKFTYIIQNNSNNTMVSI